MRFRIKQKGTTSIFVTVFSKMGMTQQFGNTNVVGKDPDNVLNS